MDYILLTRNDLQEINSIKKLLDDLFPIKDMGQLKFFLGLEVARSSKGYSVLKEIHLALV